VFLKKIQKDWTKGKQQTDSKRLPKIETEESDIKTFFKREESMKPPKEKIQVQEFPPKESFEAPKIEEKEEKQEFLLVERYFPEGTIPMASHLSVTFNSPMIELSTFEEMEKQSFPIEISPEIEGKFRWVGTKTLFFEPKFRFNMSTTYKVKIPAGTKSATGLTLQKDVAWIFETPTIQVTKKLPLDSVTFEDPLFYLHFDQKINPEEVLKTVSLNSKFDQFDLITEEEALKISSEQNSKYRQNIQYYVSSEVKDRFMWFKLKKKLNLDSSYNFAVGPKTPSAEGPKVDYSVCHSSTVRTFGKMNLLKEYVNCNNLLPCASWTFGFSNHIDVESMDPDECIQIEPKVKNLKYSVYGSNLHISGITKGKTNYIVKFNTKLKDVYDQYLAKDTEIEMKVIEPNKSLRAFQEGLIVIDPTEDKNPTFSMISVNVKRFNCAIFQVDPKDFNRSCFGRKPDKLEIQFPEKMEELCKFGNKVYEEFIEVQGDPFEPVETIIDLTPHLQHPNEKLGQLMIFCHPDKEEWKDYWNYNRAWIQCTNMAVDAILNEYNCDLCCWANSLKDGSTLQNVDFTFGGSTKKVDKTGITHFSSWSLLYDTSILIARSEKDVAFHRVPYSRSFNKEETLFHIFDDRNLYKPKEKVSIKAFVRKLKRNDVSYTLEYPNNNELISWEVYDSKYISYAKGNLKISKTGSFEFSFEIPDNVNLGSHQVTFKSSKDSIFSIFYSGHYETHNFKVQEFRTPEYKVSASSSAPSFVGDSSAVVTVNSSYFSGGSLSGAKVSWNVTQQASNYRPPGHQSFKFQKPIPFWYFGFNDTEYSYVDEVGALKFDDASTDANGEHKLCVQFSETDRKPKTPVTITATADVKDLNNQVMSSSTSFMVHPSSIYVGVKTKKTFVKPREPISLEIVTTNMKGLIVEDVTINVKAIHKEVSRNKLKSIEKNVVKVDVLMKSQNKPLEYDLVLKDSGSYLIEIESIDKNGLKNSTGTFVIVEGGSQETLSSSNNSDNIIIVADKESYSVGDEANIYVQHCYEGVVEGILSVICTGIHTQKRFDMKESSCIMKIPITKDMIPGPTIQIDLVSSAYRVDKFLNEDKELPKKPACASGDIRLSVPPAIYDLKTIVNPKETNCIPGSENEVEILVQDSFGKPVENAEVSLIVVDEAILSLTSYSILNPLETFYKGHLNYTSRISSRSMILVKDWSSISFSAIPSYHRSTFQSFGRGGINRELSDVYDLMNHNIERVLERGEKIDMLMEQSESLQSSAMSFQAFGGMPLSSSSTKSVKPETKSTPITVRSNFNPLAAFETSKTDKTGKATIKFKLPDNLTEYRVTVLSSHGMTSFGIGESSIVANLPLMIRPSPPRFLNFGDKCSFPVILQNQSNSTIDVNFTIKLSNLKLNSSSFEYLNISIPQNKRIVVKYPIETQSYGIGRIQIGAEIVGTSHADAVSRQFPIFTPSTSEAFATYGEIDEGSINQPISKPSNVFPEFGGLEITTSSTAVQSLTDAFLYVTNYKFDCIEQIASRVLSIVSLENVLNAFNVPSMPSKSKLQNIVNTSIKKFQNNQKTDGSFGFWTSTSETHIYLSIHVAHCLQRAKDQGYDIPSNLIEKSKAFLVDVDSHCKQQKMGEYSRYSLQLFAIYVLTLMKHDKEYIGKTSKNIYEKFQKFLTLDAYAWLLTSFHYADPKDPEIDVILKLFSNRVIESPETANFTTSYGENNDAQLVMLHSDRRTDAIILDSLIEVDSKNSLIPKIVKGLMKNRVRGKWGSTSESTYILLAMKKYFETYESQTPDFKVKFWFGDENQFIGEQIFEGRSTEKNLINIPMQYITDCENEKLNLIVQKEGKGRLYYRIGMMYSPKNCLLKSMDNGFIVDRTYEAVSDPSHVVKNKDGSWTFKEGELVKVKLSMTNTSVRYHVALVDYLPGGLEALNPDLPIGGSQNKETNQTGYSYGYWFCRTWFIHQNIRDERVEAFCTYLYPDVHSYSYLARATTRGEFISPPAKAEEMYSPEVFGRSKSEKVVIE
jgi:alpha-2-macroglobulin